MSLEEAYRRLVEDLAKDRTDRRIPNGEPGHARILVTEMLKNAEEGVRVFSGSFNKEVYGEPRLLEAACSMLRRGKRLKVLIQNDDELALHPLVAALANEKREHRSLVEFKKARGTYAAADAKHFAVMDGAAFRFEVNHEKCHAVANFNEPDVALVLRKTFESAFEKAVPLNVVE